MGRPAGPGDVPPARLTGVEAGLPATGAREALPPETARRPPADRPQGVEPGAPGWGSDLVVEVLRGLGIEYATLLPGASFRGLHDSLVNHGGNQRPELILCNHEMVAVCAARGYARVTGRPMVALLHDLVGLLNAGAAIYDAWVDRVPILLLGGNGPLETSARRPWIDWVHTAHDQGSVFRDFTKWDDQPASPASIAQSLLRANQIAVTEPAGPVYVCFDLADQETRLEGPPALPDFDRYRPGAPLAPDPGALAEAASRLVAARLPLAFAGSTGRSAEGVAGLLALAELLAMPTIDTARLWQSFPTPHPMDFHGLEGELVQEADLLLVMEGEDLSGLSGSLPSDQKVISVSVDQLAARGFAGDQLSLLAADVRILASPAATLPALADECRRRLGAADRDRVELRRQALSSRQKRLGDSQQAALQQALARPGISAGRLVVELWAAIDGSDFVLTAGTPRRLAPGVFSIPGPERNVAGSGGAVVGAKSGMALGAALALRDSGRLPVALVGDGDLLMAPQVLWTAAHYGLPGLWVVHNNRTYLNDEEHQGRVALARGRPLENRGIGIRMDRPPVDFAGMARSLGVMGIGPVREPAELGPALRSAWGQVKAGGIALVDVWTEPG